MGRYTTAEAFLASPTGYGRRTYRAYVPHPLAGWEPVLTADDLATVGAADVALAAAASLPTTGVGHTIAEWMMARDESIQSSIMEGVESTGAGLAWARYMDQVDRPVSDENDALTLGAAKQTAAAIELGSKMRSGAACSADDILELHSLLFDGTRDADIGGVLRDAPIWIGPPGCLVEDASFVAPPEGYVPSLLDDLVDYVNRSGHPPVLKAAVAHSQFETIHPFSDGNGRTGRALIHTVLNATGAALGTLPISTALSDDRSGYYQALNATRAVCAADDDASRSSALRPWLSLFARSCQHACDQAASTARDAEALIERWQTAGRFRSDSTAAALVEVLPTMPVLDAATVARRLGVTEQAARNALRSLESAGIVARAGGRRNLRFTVPEIVESIRRTRPDGGRLPLPPTCGFVGPRSQERCHLPSGHRGQHRYTAR
ncbi:Fic family protein [Candidatus Poriferisocius sp.]|uniref:Fic family protein n=1 Tax=Candidatus Poriferisocius sp. TaxID=3101276 RepID=UPI003B5C342B